MDRQLILYLLLALSFTVTLTSCATTGPVTTLIDQDEVITPRELKSRALYQYSRARLRLLEGDPDGALQLIGIAMEDDPDAAYLYLAAAGIHMKSSRIQEAIAATEKSVALNPGSRQAQLLLANLLSMVRRNEEAIPHYLKAVELDPAKEDAYLHLSVSYVKLFEYDKAVKILKSYLERDPDSALVNYYLGKSYEQMKLSKEAIVYFKRALASKPDFEQALIDLGISQETQGLIDDSVATYRNLLEVNPENATVRQHLIQLLIQQQRYEDALALLKEMAVSGHDSNDTQRKIGLLYLELERYDDAVTLFSLLLAKEPDSWQLRFYLASAYEGKEQNAKALEEFLKIPPTAPVYLEALSHIAYLYKEQGNPEAGLTLLTRAAEAKTGGVEPYLLLSRYLDALGKQQKGLEVLLGVAAEFPKEPRLFFTIGMLYDKIGNRDESIAMMKKVIDMAPDDAQALNYLGYTYAEMGVRLNDALEYVNRALTITPGDGFILDSLGWVYFKMKKYDLAIVNLQRALTVVADDPAILEHLAEAYYASREYDNAIATYRKLIKQEPEKKEYLDRLKKIRSESGER
jgi:tetratricopeptide (TPR) repeat protein